MIRFKTRLKNRHHIYIGVEKRLGGALEKFCMPKGQGSACDRVTYPTRGCMYVLFVTSSLIDSKKRLTNSKKAL